MNTFCYGQSIVANASVTLFYVHALARQLDTIAYVHVHAFFLYQADWYDATCMYVFALVGVGKSVLPRVCNCLWR